MFYRVTVFMLALLWLGCDDGANDPVIVINVDAGGEAAGGAGGEMAGGAGGETAGGAGGEMAGGAGGEMAGGAGGEMAGGAGGEMAGGAGGAGPCMPECPVGSVCDAGECRFDGCPDGLLECDGRCVDLLSDAENCGSCGASCREGFEAWEADFGFEIQCVSADCQYQCPQDPQVTHPGDLQDDQQNCGTCGAVCDAECVDSECICRLGYRGTLNSIAGAPCGDGCGLGGDNCQDGCCPELPQDLVEGVSAAGATHTFRFAVDAHTHMRIHVEEGDCLGMALVRFFEDDDFDLIALSDDCDLDLAMLERGRYALEVTFGEAGPYRLFRRVPRRTNDFLAPGTHERVDNDNNLSFRFAVLEDSAYELQLANLGDESCQGIWESALFTADGRQIAIRRGPRCERAGLTDQVIRAHLVAGDYVLQARAQDLSGQRYSLDARAVNHGRIVLEDARIEGPGQAVVRSLDPYQTATFVAAFPTGGVRRVRVVGDFCDVALQVAQRRRFVRRVQSGDSIRQFPVEQLYDIAANDNAGESLEPELTFEAAADETYLLQVTDVGSSTRCTLVIE